MRQTYTFDNKSDSSIDFGVDSDRVMVSVSNSVRFHYLFSLVMRKNSNYAFHKV